MTRRIAPCALMFALTCPALARAKEPFDQGSWDVHLFGSYADTFRLGDEQTQTVTLGFGYYVFDHFSIGADAVGYNFETDGDNIPAGGLNAMMRLHVFTREQFSIYLDGGGGGMYADDQIPRGGTHFNYVARTGVGGTIELGDDVHLMLGVRYFHLSNGDIHGRPRNPSIDAIETYVGVMWTF